MQSSVRDSPSQSHGQSRKKLWITLAVILVVVAAVVPLTNILLPTDFAADVDPVDTRSDVEIPDSLRPWLALSGRDNNAFDAALKEIDSAWEPGAIAPLLEVLRFHRQGLRALKIRRVLSARTSLDVQTSSDEWFRESVWSKPYQPIADYAAFKARLYENVDRSFAKYFLQADGAQIRLDEIRWGGVQHDGIPPLKNPPMVAANSQKAAYLADADVVFGIAVNGQAKCYPKRILAWHEMVKDTVGGRSLCGVYCTLCGAMIAYRTEFDGIHYELGTSGFLYRSNKLMYDHETRSLWSTLQGRPVLGPLTSTNDKRPIQLEREAVVTTTWNDWKHRHPETLVLTLDTGHDRDYGEGVAYRSYFSNDELMFSVPKVDMRLPNKAEVVGLRFPDQPGKQLAISVQFLRETPIFRGTVGDQNFVAITDSSGACRVYTLRTQEFVRLDDDQHVTDAAGNQWTITEDALTYGQDSLARLPSHRAFWFGWNAAFPDSELVK